MISSIARAPRSFKADIGGAHRSGGFAANRRVHARQRVSARPSIESTQGGTVSLTGPRRRSSKAASADASLLISTVGTLASRAIPAKVEAGATVPEVPFSASEPAMMTAAEVPFPEGVYRSLTVATWAICSAAASVSHAMLDRVAIGRAFLSEHLSAVDLERVEAGLRHALGLAK